MKKMRNILSICFGLLIILFFIILVAYIVKFSGGISDNANDWMLFITICNWGGISLLTGINVWVFYKLTSLIALENKISRSEKAILELRIEDFKQLRQSATNLKIALVRNENYQEELESFYKILLSMQASSIFSSTKLKDSTLDTIIEYLQTNTYTNISADKLKETIDRCLRTIEILIFSNQLRDERLLEEIQKNPNWFDTTLISIDSFLKKYD